MYRSVPRGVLTFNPGDWVAITKAYARDHGRHGSDPGLDMPVIAARVSASRLFTSGDSYQEWGYDGPPLEGRVVFRPRKPPTPERREAANLARRSQRRAAKRRAWSFFEPVEWDEDYGGIPAYARDFERARVPVSQIASPFINPISQERIDELARLEDLGHTLPPIIVDGPHEVEEVDYPEEKYPFLDGHYPEVGEEFWYVHDGHHRVALAIERGARYIDALVMG
jgi:hypothetical protein